MLKSGPLSVVVLDIAKAAEEGLPLKKKMFAKVSYGSTVTPRGTQHNLDEQV